MKLALEKSEYAEFQRKLEGMWVIYILIFSKKNYGTLNVVWYFNLVWNAVLYKQMGELVHDAERAREIVIFLNPYPLNLKRFQWDSWDEIYLWDISVCDHCSLILWIKNRWPNSQRSTDISHLNYLTWILVPLNNFFGNSLHFTGFYFARKYWNSR